MFHTRTVASHNFPVCQCGRLVVAVTVFAVRSGKFQITFFTVFTPSASKRPAAPIAHKTGTTAPIKWMLTMRPSGIRDRGLRVVRSRGFVLKSAVVAASGFGHGPRKNWCSAGTSGTLVLLCLPYNIHIRNGVPEWHLCKRVSVQSWLGVDARGR